MSTNTDATATIGRVAPRYLNRQQAIAFCGVKAGFFDSKIRPLLQRGQAGTSVLFKLEQLLVAADMVLGFHESAPDQDKDITNTTNQEESKWAKNRPASTRVPTNAGTSTSTTTAYDFERASKALKKPSRG